MPEQSYLLRLSTTRSAVKSSPDRTLKGSRSPIQVIQELSKVASSLGTGESVSVVQDRRSRFVNTRMNMFEARTDLGIETNRGAAPNLPPLFPPDESDHVDRIKRFLLEFKFW